MPTPSNSAFWIGGILYALVVVLRFTAGQQQRLYALIVPWWPFCNRSKKAMVV